MGKMNVVVVGGGPAGVTAALRACELGAQVTLVERARLGGTCANDGVVPVRVLAKAARLLRDSDSFSAYGLEIGRPRVDFARLVSRTQQVVFGMHEKKQLPYHLESAGVRLHTKAGRAAFVDPHTIQAGDGTRIQGDRFILCTGSRPRPVSFPGAELALTYQGIWSLARAPESLVVVGAAHTGCQLASVFASFGTRVWLLEAGAQLLGGEDGMVSQEVHRALSRRGIDIRTSIGGLRSIQPIDEGVEIHYGIEGQPESVRAEAVVLAVGQAANTEELALEVAGVATERGFVAVDDRYQTTARHIFAAGDITGRMKLVQSASLEGRIAAENAVLGGGEGYRHQIVPHGGFTDPEYASVGKTEAEARQAEPGCVVAQVRFAELDRAIVDGLPEGACKLIVSAESHKLLGAHVVGEQALEIVHLVAAGMAADMRVEQLARLELAYPTYMAIIGLAARRVMRDLGGMALAPEWSALGRPLIAEWERSESLDAPGERPS
jgi:dihydrolipoamide dehydrogenase